MKKYVIDTNVLLSFVTDRNLQQQASVAPLFTAASNFKCTLICHQFVLTEFIFVLDKVYSTPKETINTMVRELLAMPGVELRHAVDFTRVLSLWPDRMPDFGDAVVAAIGMEVKGALIVTFDQKLRSCLKRLELSVFS